MKNPDPWLPQEPAAPEEPPSRRGALIGLLVTLALIGAGLLLSHILGTMSHFQDCVLSGRMHCN